MWMFWKCELNVLNVCVKAEWKYFHLKKQIVYIKLGVHWQKILCFNMYSRPIEVYGVVYCAVVSTAGECWRTIGDVWFTEEGIASSSYDVGMGMDPKCRNMERKSSNVGSARTLGSRSNHRKRVSASVGHSAFILVKNRQSSYLLQSYPRV